MLGRRGFLGGVGAAAAGVAVAKLRDPAAPASKAGAASASLPGQGTAEVSRAGALDALGVTAGTKLHTCTVVQAATTDDGAIAVTMTASGGDRFDVELLGHDAQTPGVAQAGSLAVYMHNRGRGVTATVEEHGLAAMALAAHLASREAAGATLPSLPTLNERTGIVRAV
jgi:hypothetical protein